MVQILSNKVVIEIETSAPEDFYVNIKKSIVELIFRASQSELDHLDDSIVDVKQLLHGLEINTEQARKLIEH